MTGDTRVMLYFADETFLQEFHGEFCCFLPIRLQRDPSEKHSPAKATANLLLVGTTRAFLTRVPLGEPACQALPKASKTRGPQRWRLLHQDGLLELLYPYLK